MPSWTSQRAESFALEPQGSSLVDVNTKVKIRWIGRGLAVSFLAGVWTAAASGGRRAWAQASDAGVVATAGEVAWVKGTMPPAAPAVTRFFPLADVKRGLRGVAYTVFEGVNPEPMEVEILGVLKASLGPGQDLILA